MSTLLNCQRGYTGNSLLFTDWATPDHGKLYHACAVPEWRHHSDNMTLC